MSLIWGLRGAGALCHGAKHSTEESKKLKEEEDPGGDGAAAGLDAALRWGEEHPGKSLRGVRLQEKESLTEAEEMDVSRRWD